MSVCFCSCCTFPQTPGINVSTPQPPAFYISGGVLFSLQGLVLFLCSVSFNRQHKALMWASVRVIVLTAMPRKIAWVRRLGDQRLYVLRLDEQRLKIFERCCESLYCIWSRRVRHGWPKGSRTQTSSLGRVAMPCS